MTADMQASPRVVLADDSVLFRTGLAHILAGAGFEVVGVAGTADELLEVVRARQPNVAVVDVRMPPTFTTEGVRAALAIRSELPEVGVLMLSHHIETEHVSTLLRDNARGFGYLLKDRVADIDTLLDGVRTVALGRSVIDPDVISELIGRQRHRRAIAELSDREKSVLELMAQGRSNVAIGQKLFLSEKTVEAYVRSIFSKLGLEPAADDHRRVLAVLAHLRS
jgi:DNA-binding NarL/FixJ family response regulator